jgi:uncharacterized membrane protein
MNIKTVPLGRGFDWINEGFGLFLKNPLIWIINLVIFLAIVTVLSLIPFIGAFAALLLQPVLIGGMLLGCQALERGEELRIEHLFDCFRRDANPLIMLGLYSGIAYLLVGAVIFVLVGGAVGLGVLGEITNRPDVAFSGAMLGFVFSGLIGMALSIPIAMATWFAPALVIFRRLPALEAMKASFFGCLRNMMPFLLYGIVLLLFAAIAAIPFGLGLLVLGPTLIASVYTGYRDIFGE